MKIKTVIFWILWVGNDLTLQTVREQNPDPSSPPSFPSRRDDVDRVIQTLELTAPPMEDVQQLAFNAEQRTGTPNDAGIFCTGTNFAF